MSINVACVAVRTCQWSEVVRLLHVESTGRIVTSGDFNKSTAIIGRLNREWSLILDGTFQIGYNIEDLQNLSRVFDTLVCKIGEGWMHSEITFYQSSEPVWHVSFDYSSNPYLFEEKGDLPRNYSILKKRALKRISADPDSENSILFDVPTDLFSEIVGFKYNSQESLELPNFEVLSIESSDSKNLLKENLVRLTDSQIERELTKLDHLKDSSRDKWRAQLLYIDIGIFKERNKEFIERYFGKADEQVSSSSESEESLIYNLGDSFELRFVFHEGLYSHHDTLFCISKEEWQARFRRNR